MSPQMNPFYEMWWADNTLVIKTSQAWTSDEAKSLQIFFLKLMFVDWKSKVKKLNQAAENERCKCKKFKAEAFLIGLALIIGSSEFSQQGGDLFGSKEAEDDDDYYWNSISFYPHL